MRVQSPSRGFVLAYALAYIGMFVTFMPLVMVLLPLKVEAVAGAAKVPLLSAAALSGAAVASGTNIVFGMLSDRSYRRSNTRRPWIALGLVTLLAGYALLHQAGTEVTLLAGVALIQTGINMMFAPLLAVMADEVPDDIKGSVAGLLGIAQPLSTLVAVAVTLPWIGGAANGYALVCGLVVLLLAPLLALMRERPAGLGAIPAPQFRAQRRLDFGLAWVAKILVQVTGNGLTTYGFYYLASQLPRGTGAAGTIAAIMAGSTVLAVVLTIAAGHFSDRMMRRKPFLLGSALVVAGGFATMAMAEDPAMAAAGYAAATCGISAFLAVHAALAMQLLPSPGHRGRDLGVLNLTNTLPAMVAPLLAMALGPERGFAPLLVALALGSLAGGLVALAVRSQR